MTREMNKPDWHYEWYAQNTVQKMATCINSGEVVADLEYTSPVLPDIYYDSKKCVQDTKQWLESEVRE